MLLSRFAVGMLPIGLMVLGAGTVSGQDYPNKPIRIITAAAGGGSDATTRLVTPGISESLGQPVVVDNRTSLQATEAVSKASPDGYTLLVSGANMWILPLLQKASYDTVRDFSPISLLVREVNVFAAHPSLPVKSIKDLIAMAKARPGELNYGSGLPGSPNHLGMELFKSMAGVNIARITFKVTSVIITSVIGGEVQVTIADVGLVAPHVKSGRLRALAVTSAQPSVLAPGLPTVAAAGLPGYEVVGMTGILAPAKTPGAIITRLNQEIVRTLNRTEVKERVLNGGAEVVASSPEQYGTVIKEDISKMGKVIKEAGIKIE